MLTESVNDKDKRTNLRPHGAIVFGVALEGEVENGFLVLVLQ